LEEDNNIKEVKEIIQRAKENRKCKQPQYFRSTWSENAEK
jgi:hypothetical protein